MADRFMDIYNSLSTFDKEVLLRYARGLQREAAAKQNQQQPPASTACFSFQQKKHELRTTPSKFYTEPGPDPPLPLFTKPLPVDILPVSNHTVIDGIDRKEYRKNVGLDKEPLESAGRYVENLVWYDAKAKQFWRVDRTSYHDKALCWDIFNIDGSFYGKDTVGDIEVRGYTPMLVTEFNQFL
jgi:hypothetical protein